MQRRDTSMRKYRQPLSLAIVMVLIGAKVGSNSAHATDITAEPVIAPSAISTVLQQTLPSAAPSMPALNLEAQPTAKTPPSNQPLPQAEELALAQARYLSHGVYLGNYPGFIAPGHSLSGTYFLPAETTLAIHYRAQPYQGEMPSAQLLINGQPILELTKLDNQILTAKIPRTFAGRLAELTIAFADYLPASGSIQLDSQRTPINIPLLHIHALVLQPELQSQLISYD